LGGVRGPAAGEDVDHAEVGGRVDDAEEHRNRDHGSEQRQLDLEQSPPESRAVHNGGLHHVLRQRRQAGEHDEGREREDAPRLHDDDRHEARLGSPASRASRAAGRPL